MCGAGISEPLAVAAALHSPAAGHHFNHCAAVDTMVRALLNCPRGNHVWRDMLTVNAHSQHACVLCSHIHVAAGRRNLGNASCQ